MNLKTSTNLDATPRAGARRKLSGFLPLALAAHLLWSGAAMADLSNAAVIQTWMKSSNELMALTEKSAVSEARKAELQKWLTGGEAGFKNPEDMLPFLAAVFDLGVTPAAGGSASGWIEQPAVVRLLAETLQSTNADVRNRAAHYLTEYARDQDLRAHQDLIFQAATREGFSSKSRLVAKLKPSAEQAARVLPQSSVLPPEVRARLGNDEELNGLIRSFESARDYQEKRRLAELLGYVGGESAGRALAASMGSKLFIGGAYEHQSIRVDIIKALGRIHQTEPLLNQDFLKAVGRTDSDREATVNYLKDVQAWINKQYGLSVALNFDETSGEPLLVRRFVVKRPIGKTN